MNARREMGTAVVAALAGAALVLAVAGRVWTTGDAPVHGSLLAVEATGTAVTKVPTALAFLGLAGALAVWATRRAGRVAGGLLLALAGAGIAVASAAGAGDRSAIDRAAASKAAVTGVRAVDVAGSAWPWLSLAGGLCVLLAGVVVAVRGSRWPGMSSRYEAPGRAGRAPRREATSADLWNALDRGEDPTR
jgi:uncharacterized membrane protein (TIGR02234 family)